MNQPANQPPSDDEVEDIIDVLYEGQEIPDKPNVTEILDPGAVNPGPEDIVSDSSSRHSDSRSFRIPFLKGGRGNRGGGNRRENKKEKRRWGRRR